METVHPKRVLFLVGEDSSFVTHRLNLAKFLKQKGYDVSVATKCTRFKKTIQQAGIFLYELHFFHRSRIHPLKEMRAFLEIYRVYKHCKPDIAHHVAMKPIIYGGCITKILKQSFVINAITGLGYLFTTQTKLNLKKRALKLFALFCLRFVFNQKNAHCLFQNQDDLNALQDLKILEFPKENIHLIRGAGVNLKDFKVVEPPDSKTIVIACVSRILKDKGILELVGAAKLLQENQINAKVILYGSPDKANPSYIKTSEIESWVAQKWITWAGHTLDTAKAYANCHIAVLPSYREGLPKSLLEAASCARPIVTTNVPGCKEVVQHGENGLLVEPKSVEGLYQALCTLIDNPNLRKAMGKASRRRVEQYFSDTIIYGQTLELYQTFT